MNNYQEGCIFCQISCGKSPCYKVWENNNYMAFLSIFPNTKGLTVLIPKIHQSSYIFDQDNQGIANIMLATKEVAALIVRKLDTVARVATVFEGYGVDHLHVKLFPLHDTVGPWRVINADYKINTKYTTYPGYISTHDGDRASDKELKEVADLLTK